MGEETEFKRWFRSRLSGWSETHEPRHGSSVGLPDLVVLEGFWLIPIELKLGTVAGGRLELVGELRPAQIRWHVIFRRYGGIARMVVGVRDDKRGWVPWIVPWTDESMIGWKDGWDIMDCREWEFDK